VLDDKDRKILRELRRDAKQTTKAIAEATGVPRTTVHDRICKMEDRGVIHQYTVVPDYNELGQSTAAFVFATYDGSDEADQGEVARKVADMDGVHEVHIISGDWDLLAKVRGASVDEIGDLVIEQLRELGGVGRTQTCTVFDTLSDGP
jgi:DNA-binding Lrp family transcriptional regulator